MSNTGKKSIIGAMASVSFVVIIAKVLGFVKQIVTADAFGATIQTDLISISEGLVLNLDYLLIQTLSTAFIPIYIHIKSEKCDEEKRFVSNTIKVFLFITITLMCVFLLLSPIISKVLAPTYNDELSFQLSNYIRLLSPIIIILVEMSVYNSLLKANEKFVLGELVSLFQSVIIIFLVLILGKKLGPDTLVFAFYFYAIFNLVFLMICSRKYWSLSKDNPFKDPNIRKLLTMMGPLFLGYSVIFVNQQVDKIIVSGLGAGTVTAMTYASVLSNFINTFIGSICAVLFTYITQSIAEKRDKDAADLTTQATIKIVTLMIPISVLAIVNSEDIVTIVFGHGKFDSSAIKSCSLALVGYSISFAPFVIRELYSRFQYAYKDSKTPMINSSIAIVINILLSILLSINLGVLGVTIATSISVIICAILNILSSAKRNKYVKANGFVKYIVRWVLGIIVCLLISHVGKVVLYDIHVVFRFIIITLVSMVIYCLVNLNVVLPLVNKAIKSK